MKLVRVGARGAEQPGVLESDGRVRDVGSLIRNKNFDLWSSELLRALRSADLSGLPVHPPGVRMGPCVAGVGKFICVGLNYADHAREAGVAPPAEPVLFMKATSAISGPYDPIVIPPEATKVDWEVELGVVIGATAKRVPPERAREHIAGFCVVNDVSERAYQLEGTGQWVKGKSADSFGPIGPYLATTDEVRDPQNMTLWLSVNGVQRQRSCTREMIFGVNVLVSYISRFMTLHPGDIISTGTPPGVGMGLNPPTYLRAGDVVSLGIEGLGEQRQEVIAE